MNNVKKPHKHAELIKQWADGATIQIRNESFGSADVGPEWKDLPWGFPPAWHLHTTYRVKPKDYPKNTLNHSKICSVYYNGANVVGADAEVKAWHRIADEAIKNFIESGEMVKYFTNPDNGYITEDNF